MDLGEVNGVHYVLIHIYTDDFDFSAGKESSCWQADVAEADDGNSFKVLAHSVGDWLLVGSANSSKILRMRWHAMPSPKGLWAKAMDL